MIDYNVWSWVAKMLGENVVNIARKVSQDDVPMNKWTPRK